MPLPFNLSLGGPISLIPVLFRWTFNPSSGEFEGAGINLISRGSDGYPILCWPRRISDMALDRCQIFHRCEETKPGDPKYLPAAMPFIINDLGDGAEVTGKFWIEPEDPFKQASMRLKRIVGDTHEDPL